MAVFMSFNMINVNSMQNDNGVFVGQNNQPGWDSHAKQNSSNFPIGALNTFPGNINLLTDNDAIDMPFNDSDIEGGSAVQGF